MLKTYVVGFFAHLFRFGQDEFDLLGPNAHQFFQFLNKIRIPQLWSDSVFFQSYVQIIADIYFLKLKSRSKFYNVRLKKCKFLYIFWTDRKLKKLTSNLEFKKPYANVGTWFNKRNIFHVSATLFKFSQFLKFQTAILAKWL